MNTTVQQLEILIDYVKSTIIDSTVMRNSRKNYTKKKNGITEELLQ